MTHPFNPKAGCGHYRALAMICQARHPEIPATLYVPTAGFSNAWLAKSENVTAAREIRSQPPGNSTPKPKALNPQLSTAKRPSASAANSRHRFPDQPMVRSMAKSPESAAFGDAV